MPRLNEYNGVKEIIFGFMVEELQFNVQPFINAKRLSRRVAFLSNKMQLATGSLLEF
jgi:hypothetical protein